MQETQDCQSKLCRICKSFHGSASTDFLCSKCFREQASERQATQANAQGVQRLIENNTQTVPMPENTVQQQPPEQLQAAQEMAPAIEASQPELQALLEEVKVDEDGDSVMADAVVEPVQDAQVQETQPLPNADVVIEQPLG